ncbi:hypothetical protein A2803_03900 [Candidatus Woesebacteria bacterium RIFCSPHIGHO2_01_FULL_44_21]|uniref:Glycosyltransferase 2-like domain-containing protein n=1 Tax=Candidatus Woesebacteria bacterium RIFCSPHIGHO2_01_FULL_44_21 TaxID=1802503 RepID=A0A1F7YWL2_9BACT|nr:MAG: hypothetical protein A2803_03900 [Candidatus Woesebacteria bacterium RIFCSPHIGHO2_01_FULL_44_21]
MKNKPLVSVIIATYNSAKVLPKVLGALEKQSYPEVRRETVIVDGGSSDQTLKIAKSYNCKIIKNPSKDPVSGKHLGYLKAKGKYLMYLDHDEVLQNMDSITNKVHCLEKENINAIAGGNYVNPKNYPFINEYVNEFGDPFSFFIYRISKRDKYFLVSMKRRFKIISETKDYAIFDLNKTANLPLFELVAGGSIFNGEYLKNAFPQTLKDKLLVPHYYYLIYTKYQSIALMKNDPIEHYSSETYTRYLKKISWRVRNNIHFSGSLGESGFSGRQKYSKSNKYKKYLFIPYSYSLIFPLIDGLYLSLTRKNFLYMMHLPLCVYTASLILYHQSLRLLGVKFDLKTYGS